MSLTSPPLPHPPLPAANPVGNRECGLATNAAALKVNIGFMVTKTFYYVSGTGVTANDPVAPAVFHNAFDTPLVVDVKFTPTSYITLATPAVPSVVTRTGGTTGTASVPWLSPSGSVLTGVAVTTTAYKYGLAFSVGSNYPLAQAFTLSFDCPLITDVNQAIALTYKCSMSGSTPVTNVIKIGFKPFYSLTFTNASFPVDDRTIQPTSVIVNTLAKNAWLPPLQSNVVLSLTAGVTGTGLSGAGVLLFKTGATLPAFSVDDSTGADELLKKVARQGDSTFNTANAIPTGLTATAALTNSDGVVTYTLDSLSFFAPGEYTLTLKGGSLIGSTSTAEEVGNVEMAITLLVGYDLKIELARGAATANVLTLWQDPCITAVDAVTQCDGVMKFQVIPMIHAGGETYTVAFDSTSRDVISARAAAGKTPLFYSTASGYSVRGVLPDNQIRGTSDFVPTSTADAALVWELATSRADTRPDTYTFQIKQGTLKAAIGTTVAFNAGSSPDFGK